MSSGLPPEATSLSTYHGVVFDISGNLYGTSQYGGASNCGTVFKLTHNSDGSWTENNLHDFDCTDGNWAIAGVVFDKSGNLYGTTTFGGTYNAGVLFQLTPNSDGTWNYNILHTFTAGSDGANPGHGSLTFDSNGNLYGTAAGGGLNSVPSFILVAAPFSKCRRKPTVHGRSTFSTASPAATTAPVRSMASPSTTRETCRTTYSGGKYQDGTVFELIAHSSGKYSERVLHAFRGGDGLNPFSGVIFDSAGDLLARPLMVEITSAPMRQVAVSCTNSRQIHPAAIPTKLWFTSTARPSTAPTAIL